MRIYNYHHENRLCQIHYLSRSNEYKLILKTKNHEIIERSSTLSSLWTQIEYNYRENTNPMSFPSKFYKIVRASIAKICNK